MVLAGRSSRAEGGRRRWLVLGLVITVIVLLIDASIKSADPARARQLGALAWLDRSFTLVGQSNVQAAELNGFRTASLAGLTAGQVTAELDTLTTGTQATYTQLEAQRAPALLDSSAGLLQTSLLLRSRAAAAIAGAVKSDLSAAGVTTSGAASDRGATGVTTSGAAGAWAAATAQLQLSDQAYRLFAAAVPASLGVTAPTSAWVTTAGLYAPTSLEVFLRALRSQVSLAPVHLLQIVSMGTTPTPVGTTGPKQSVQVLLPSTDLEVTVVVGNPGNQVESDLTVTATLSASNGTSSVHKPLQLAPGAVAAVTLGGLQPRLGATATLTVSVMAPAGGATPAARRIIRFVMPAPSSAPTTTVPRG
jgi:hypothetical protein